MQKILIVEDDRDIAGNVADYLKAADASLDCAVAYDGITGFGMAASDDSVDLVILDIGLPDLDGISLCRRLRGIGGTRPIIMLTARDTVEDKVKGLENGADDYLVKPFSLAELLARVHALLRRTERPSSKDTLRVGDLELCRSTRDVRRAGRLLRLGPTEFRILEFLMERSPGVVLRAEMEDLWETPPSAETIRSHIYLLRSVMDKPFASQMLHTVPNVGWTLRPGTMKE